MTEKYTIEDIKDIAKAQKGQCLSKRYTNCKTKLRWRCSNGHIWKNTLDHIKQGQWCRVCAAEKNANRLRGSIKQMQALAKAKGGKCLSSIYFNARTKLKWECRKGHIWYAVPGRWCPYCATEEKASKYRLSLKEMQNLAKERGGKCLSTKYINARTKLKWKCKRQHIFLATPCDIKGNRKSWCPECNTAGITEQFCRKIFEKIFKRKFPTIRPTWLINSKGAHMHLDGFCEQLNLAFEYNGSQHYKDHSFFHRKKGQTLAKRIKDDRFKRRLCKKHGIILLIIPYTIKTTQLQEYILNQCLKRGFKVPTDLSYFNYFTLNNEHSSQKLVKLQQIAKKRGGLCLSKGYLGATTKLRWRCKKGHVWSAVPDSIRRGTWCHRCSIKDRADKRKLGIQKMYELAKLKGGYCLSKEYVNDRTKLKWQCHKKHIWFSPPRSIMHGHWCPYCAGIAKHTLLEMQELAKEKGGKCLSRTYINSQTKLEWQCKKGHTWVATPLCVRKHWCPYCAGNAKSNISEMQKLAGERGGKCLSNKYRGRHIKLKWQCKNGHTWLTTPRTILNGHWCPHCAGNAKLNINEMQKLAKEKGGRCLSKDYMGANTKLQWLCKEDHEWNATPASIKSGTWCPKC